MISTDDAEKNKAFAEQEHADFPMLSNPAKDVANAYGVLGTTGFARRWTFYIDPNGVIQKIDKTVHTATAGADLLANLEALKVPKKK